MLYAVNLHTGDRRTFQGAQQNSANGIAQSMAIASLEGFRGKFRVGFGCALFILLQAVGQFESS